MLSGSQAQRFAQCPRRGQAQSTRRGSHARHVGVAEPDPAELQRRRGPALRANLAKLLRQHLLATIRRGCEGKDQRKPQQLDEQPRTIARLGRHADFVPVRRSIEVPEHFHGQPRLTQPGVAEHRAQGGPPLGQAVRQRTRQRGQLLRAAHALGPGLHGARQRVVVALGHAQHLRAPLDRL